MLHLVKKADCEEKREKACLEFKKDLYQHFQLDRIENIKKSSWKNPITKARKALKENGFKDSVKYLTAEWNKRNLRDENGKWIEDREAVAKILESEKKILKMKQTINSRRNRRLKLKIICSLF